MKVTIYQFAPVQSYLNYDANMKTKKELVLTYKEAIAIMELLETLEGMGGAYDEYFTNEAQRAGK